MIRLIRLIVVGGLAGWIADELAGNDRFGLVGNILLGIAGAIIGGWLISRFTGHEGRRGCITSTVVAVIGAVLLLFVVNLAAGR